MRQQIADTDVLLVVDVQNDFCPGGKLAVPDGDEIVPLVNQLGNRFQHVVLTQDWHPSGHRSFASANSGRQPFETVAFAYGPQVLWPDHCVQDTPGAQFHAGLQIPHAELILRKGYRRDIDSYSAFYENDHATPTGLAGYLRERGLRACSLPVSRSTSACATRPRTRTAAASRSWWSRMPAAASTWAARWTRRAGPSARLGIPRVAAEAIG